MIGLRKLVISIIFLSLGVYTHAQEIVLASLAETITAEELSAHVYVLAADSMGGRFTGTPGLEKAASYIAQNFSMAELKSPADFKRAFYQDLDLKNCYWTKLGMSTTNRKWKYGTDFSVLIDPLSGTNSYDAVFAGFGIDHKDYSDYNELDVKGKMVFILQGEPKTSKNSYYISGTEERSDASDFYQKILNASDRGAAGLVLVSAKNDSPAIHFKESGSGIETARYSYQDEEFFKFPALYVNPSLAASVFDVPKKIMKKAVRKMGGSGTLAVPRMKGSFDVIAEEECAALPTSNIVGFIKGTDLSDEVVVVVAHYDHLGVIDGEIYHGADDNASGTAALLEIADAVGMAKKDGIHARRSILFLTATAEEIGLYGSKYYTENPVFPLEKTVAAVNIDMIGGQGSKFGDPDYIYGWTYHSEELLDVADRYAGIFAPDLDFRMTNSHSSGGGSDQYYFVKQEIPAVFYFTGIHYDYHEPTDTPEKLFYDRMEATTRSIFGMVWHLANVDDVPVFEKEEE